MRTIKIGIISLIWIALASQAMGQFSMFNCTFGWGCNGPGTSGGGAAAGTTCKGNIDLGAGCALPMFGGL
jgi:hypothetical protein